MEMSSQMRISISFARLDRRQMAVFAQQKPNKGPADALVEASCNSFISLLKHLTQFPPRPQIN